MNIRQYCKRFEFPLVRKALDKGSPFTMRRKTNKHQGFNKWTIAANKGQVASLLILYHGTDHRPGWDPLSARLVITMLMSQIGAGVVARYHRQCEKE